MITRKLNQSYSILDLIMINQHWIWLPVKFSRLPFQVCQSKLIKKYINQSINQPINQFPFDEILHIKLHVNWIFIRVNDRRDCFKLWD